MSVDAQAWFAYADENLAVAQLALKNCYFNACLQNAQQAVEK
jgi:HEPN domain-containing protein